MTNQKNAVKATAFCVKKIITEKSSVLYIVRTEILFLDVIAVKNSLVIISML